MLDTWLVMNGHKGVNQQGNKSLLSYRTGYGVPVRAWRGMSLYTGQQWL